MNNKQTQLNMDGLVVNMDMVKWNENGKEQLPILKTKPLICENHVPQNFVQTRYPIYFIHLEDRKLLERITNGCYKCIIIHRLASFLQVTT